MATAQLITAMDLEKQAELQQIADMKIVETGQGYELHIPLRAWLHNETAIRQTADGPQVVIGLSEPTWHVLRTRRESAPRLFKNLITIFTYIEEKLPSVKNVEVTILNRPVTKAAKKAPAGKTSGKAGRAAKKAAKKAPAKKAAAKKPPAKKSAKKAAKPAKKATKRR